MDAMEEQLPLIDEDRSARRRAGTTRTPRAPRWAPALDAETRRIGLEGVANARATLRAARAARQADERQHPRAA